MSMLGAFIGGVAKTRLADMQAADDDSRNLDRFKKQQEILEQMRKKAEEARVTAKKMVLGGNADDGPQPLMAEEYNAQGRVIGTREASKGEEEEYVQGKQSRATNLAAAQTEANRAAAKEARAEEAHESRLLTDKSRRESDSAYRTNLAKPSGGTEDEAELMKEINKLTSDPVIREAIAAGDPQALQEFGPPDLGAVDSAIRKYGKMLGGKMADEDRPTVEESLRKQEDPAIRIKTLEMYLRRLRQAEARGQSKGKGIRQLAAP